ncbi:hypothetical protein QFC19_008614 [Naganishia cerealis]|uniref:Uncharacterized protein n=1 Tax=Naganishia cerealis TaxID=610337 RepID=A0ACC2V186_9TREE|nr:hypothetical protein QFC19_008614 [Naganishia cerealis]
MNESREDVIAETGPAGVASSETGFDGLRSTPTTTPFATYFSGGGAESRQQQVAPLDRLPLSSTVLDANEPRLVVEEELTDMQRQPTRETSPDMTNYNDSMALEVCSLFAHVTDLPDAKRLPLLINDPICYLEDVAFARTQNLERRTPMDIGRLSTSQIVKATLPSQPFGEVAVYDVTGIMRTLLDNGTEFKVISYFLEDMLTRCELSPEERDGLARTYSELTERLFSKVDWAQNHRIETLQAFIVIGEYWHCFDLSERHWSLLGTAVKVAQNIGMSRLGPEPEGIVTESVARARYGSRWAAAADRETARRVWFSLVCYTFLSSIDALD